MDLPESIQQELSTRHQITVEDVRPCSGGSINRSVKLSTNRGQLFLKWNRQAPDDFFEKEAEGLQQLKQAESSPRIPEVIATGAPRDDMPGFLVMEFIREGKSGDSFQYGKEVAVLHQNRASQYGDKADNYIGSLPQSNRHHKTWMSFFTEERINPMLKMAVDSGRMDPGIQSNWERLVNKLGELFPPCKPSLLHGDLWSGNYLFDENGSGVLIDPAVYFGHPEMDLAFSKMFGGFNRDFYDGYESVSPLEPGFSDRVPIYNLYPLLVHVNLFGGHYATQCNRILKNF